MSAFSLSELACTTATSPHSTVFAHAGAPALAQHFPAQQHGCCWASTLLVVLCAAWMLSRCREARQAGGC
jgi:hypothetical protein